MATDLKTTPEGEVGVGDYQYGFHDPVDKYVFTARKGIDRDIVSQISGIKNEPDWMVEFRLKAYRHWLSMTEPKNWPNISYPVAVTASTRPPAETMRPAF